MKISSLKFILNLPLAQKNRLKTLSRFLYWGIRNKLNSSNMIYTFIGNTKINIQKGISTSELQYYCGLSEFNDMGFLLHFLRPEDVFVDVGANIGSYTLLSSSFIGAKTISVEPVPVTFQYLTDNISLNQANDKVVLLNIGLADKVSELKFTSVLDAVNHVLHENSKTDEDFISVKVDTLDNITKEENPICIKIDVEGYETLVIKGAEETLNKETLKAIIIELNGSADMYGFDESLIHQKLILSGYTPYQYDPFTRTLIKLEKHGIFNTIYIKDIEFVENRLKNSSKVKVFGEIF